MTRASTSTKSTELKKPTVKASASRSAKLPRRSNRLAPELSNVVVAPVRHITKREQLAAMLVRDEGATLDQMIAATGWLPHTTRAALTGLRKAGYAIDSDKIDGVRTYRMVTPK